MKKTFILVGLLPMIMNAQSFTELPSILHSLYYSNSCVADIDNDGVMDIVINGAQDTNSDDFPETTYSQAYLLKNGQFTASHTLNNGGTHSGPIKVFDFNNDGLKDIVTVGLNYDYGTKHYRYINTGNGFNSVFDDQGKISGDMDVFDFNHDGLLDYAISGIESSSAPRHILHYQNSPSGFQLTSNLLSDGTIYGNFKVVDINNDKELDLIIIGIDDSDQPVCKTYLNNNGVLTLHEVYIGIVGAIDIADFNNDGFMDFAGIGHDGLEDYFSYFINDGQGNFTQTEIPGAGLSNPSIHCADFNNDGYPDIITIGARNYEPITEVYYYHPTQNTFVKDQNTGLIPIDGPGFINSLDMDGDNDLDIVMTGFDWNGSGKLLSKLYQNNQTTINHPPMPPTQLSSTISGNRVEFNWSGATDDKTTAEGLSYEIRIGTSPGAVDIANYEVKTPGWYIDFASIPSNIYWSVRSIDASRVKSVYSSEHETLSVNEAHKKTADIVIYPNPTDDVFHISTHKENIEKIEIYSAGGALVKVLGGKAKEYTISDLLSGTYIVKIKLSDADKFIIQKLIKK